MGFFLGRASPAIHDVTLSRDRLRELARRVAVLLEVAAADWDYLYTQPSQLTKIVPHRCEIELTLGRRIGKNGHQIPVTVRAVRLPGAAAEQPDLLRLEHLDDALDDSWRDGYGYHISEASEVGNGGQGARSRRRWREGAADPGRSISWTPKR